MPLPLHLVSAIAQALLDVKLIENAAMMCLMQASPSSFGLRRVDLIGLYHGGEVSIFIFRSVLYFLLHSASAYRQPFVFLYISSCFPSSSASSGLGCSVITTFTLSGRLFAQLHNFVACGIPFFIDMYKNILFLFYAGLVRLAHAAYSVQDDYDASNWVDMFNFDTVGVVRLESAVWLSMLIV